MTPPPCANCGNPVQAYNHDGQHWKQAGRPYCAVCTWLTIPEAFALLRISRATYYRLVKAGKLHPRHISPARVLVPRADVDAILA